jgi:hypothetical protein
MMRTRLQRRLAAAILATVCLIVASPREAAAGQGPQAPGQPPPAQGNVIVQRVENGPAFGVEFKFTDVGGQDAYLLGGYGGAVFDGKLFVGGAGYFQVDSWYHDYDYDDCGYNDYYYDSCNYHGSKSGNAYGGLLLEWYLLHKPGVALSARGLIGGGVVTVGSDGFYDYVQPPDTRHGSMYPPSYPPAGGYYYLYDQGYFVFEPQVNVAVRIVPGVALVGGVGYRVIGWANGLEDQIQGVTATFAVRFGVK